VIARHTEPVTVVVFSGGRGSTVLSKELIGRPDVRLTLAINGYDDGMSTGEVRRFLGDSLGPSDFRKNASHLARGLGSCRVELVELLDVRLPDGSTRETATAFLRSIDQPAVAERLEAFVRELETSGKPFDFSDCSVGNLVFAGSVLQAGRRFNAAIDDYCALLGLPPGLIENVSDGTNAFLVALDPQGRLLASEAEIVDANRRNRIKDIYIVDRPPAPDVMAAKSPDELAVWLAAHERQTPVNGRLVDRIAAADLIVYSPGTQHSSLFPSYVTHGLSTAIARNLSAVKLLITNIQTDAETTGATAVEIIEKAIYYLEEKGHLRIPAPCLITHYLINDSRRPEDEAPYLPLGRLESLEDPRLVRIGNYEDGVTGRHDPAKVLMPFLETLLPKPRQRVAIWLHDTGSRNKLAQTVLEMVRAGIHELPLDVTVFYSGSEALEAEFAATLPITVRAAGTSPATRFPRPLLDGGYDYVVLFEASGMYNGEDIVSLAAYLSSGRLDAVWGSRRLSVNDIEASIRLRYKHKPWLRFASAVGSHLLSAVYLVLYGRYVSDTLSGVRAIRLRHVASLDVDIDDKMLNQRLLSGLLKQRAEILETPVRFYSMSPGQVRRTSIMEGIHALTTIVRERLRPAAPSLQRD
jgi:2-phospho-L-lactate transferase/gluconeogenesis factor (CofD/UPF0052 family)